ncbi:hypothetical protein [Bergeyella zoohelcum]|uniref:Uncharacterized protein n=1 Tax=Bergeyella zoohelcum TaxID=1015 RepID=A0A7Z9CFM4_9FLAO|nr:hypothetical protein [Bergeyella zoohelcum]VDH03394.1 Uncharacterised protein [Bergeyella zoohelcum]
MKYRIYIVEKKGVIYRIEEDYPEVGCYFYVIKNGRIIYDSLQDNVKLCMEIAEEEYGILESEWIEMS